MPMEKSAGAIIFTKNKETKYLLLHYPSSAKSPKEYWDFPKGHIEKGEKPEDTVKREVEEETGLKEIEFAEGFKETINYFFKFQGETVFKTVFYLLAETKTKKIRISSEHLGFKWLSYEDAFKKLTFKNAQEILRKATKHLREK